MSPKTRVSPGWEVAVEKVLIRGGEGGNRSPVRPPANTAGLLKFKIESCDSVLGCRLAPNLERS